MKNYYQQGDVLIKEYQGKIKGEKLNHLTLAEGEVTGHSHQIIGGQAELLLSNSMLYLKVLSDSALLKHEEHGEIAIPKGDYVIEKVLEYDHFLEESREVRD